MRLFGRRRYRLSDIWGRDDATFARYGASFTGLLWRVSVGRFHKAFGATICQVKYILDISANLFAIQVH